MLRNQLLLVSAPLTVIVAGYGESWLIFYNNSVRSVLVFEHLFTAPDSDAIMCKWLVYILFPWNFWIKRLSPYIGLDYLTFKHT